jgi:uncharacterized ParB-like nuclease family protein
MKTRAIAVVLAIAGVSAGLASCASQASAAAAQPTAAFSLPMPAGSFAIGRVGYEWTDASRPDTYSADPMAHRALMVYLWYPAAKKIAGQAAPYLPGARQMDANPDVRSRMTEEYGALWPLMVSGEIESHAIANAPASETPKRFPVVLLSHGTVEYTSLIEELVSHGYVVAAIEHTYMATDVAFPGGRVVPAHRDPVPEGLSPGQRWQRMVESATLGIGRGADDLRFVLNRLTDLNVSGALGFPLWRRLDLSRVAAMGHSAGGAIAARACQLDARIRACVSLDGELPPVAAFPEYPDGKGFQQPVLLLEVDQAGKRKPFSEADYANFLKKEEAQLNLCPKGSYHVLLNSPGLYHGSFSDYWLRVANGDPVKTGQALHNLRLTQAFTLAFLDKTLKGAKEPLFEKPPASPEATVTEYGH